MRGIWWLMLAFITVVLPACSKQPVENYVPVDPVNTQKSNFIFGADLSFTNQLVDLNAVFKDNGTALNPFKIFKAHGTNLVRLRLWHTPTWTREVYGANGKKMYSDLADVEQSIRLAKQQQLKVLLDFHYSDTWADPGKQYTPEAWKNIESISVLKDSVYNYTFHTLSYLNQQGLMPDQVQIGNETNCGMLYTDVKSGFPNTNVCDGNWSNFGVLINSAISAVRKVSAGSSIKTKIVLHVADPVNADWWFDDLKTKGGVSDFDIVGFSYYPIWHKAVSLAQLSGKIAALKNKFKKDVLIVETAYPWSENGNDNYVNHFGPGSAIEGYPLSVESQYNMLKDITQATISGGGLGVIYWAPDWISIPAMKDLWGQGSSWENCAFFDYSGNTVKAIDFPGFNYTWLP